MSKLKTFISGIKRALFNSGWTCNACGREIFSGYFCEDCLKKIEKIGENKCEHCGRITPYKTGYCDSCVDKNINFDIARSVYCYSQPLSYLIQNFKYDNFKYHAEFFAKEMFDLYNREGFNCDFVTFVPMSEKRLSKRGYNHAKLLAEEFSNLSNLEVIECLEKTRETENQANLSYQERVKNLQGSFKADKRLVKDKSVLLIDDVLTTGSTTDVVSRVLKKAGARKVSVLTVASVSKKVD